MTRFVSIIAILCFVLILGCQKPSDGPLAPEATEVEDSQKVESPKATLQKPVAPIDRFRPSLYVELPENCPTPDGMTMDEESGMIYLNCPNFADRTPEKKKKHQSVLLSIDPKGKLTELLKYPPHSETGEAGPMGMDIGPDGHLYVADNQYFLDKNGKSSVLQVEMVGGRPTGKIEVVATGLNLANALAWRDGQMYVTDTFLDRTGKFGSGGVWQFAIEELDPKSPVKVNVKGKDSHLIVEFDETKEVGRKESAGADGCVFDADGNLWVGNFGDGVVHRVTFGPGSKVKKVEKIVDLDEFRCCDGIYFDSTSGLIYLTDSMRNAIWTLDPQSLEFKLLWENGDTDGADGLLDQPCECVVRDGKLIIVNFDWPFPGLKNTKFDKPYTLSVIDLDSKEKEIKAEEKK
jgi:SMP-30/Gluconolactonase/LRE-like region